MRSKIISVLLCLLMIFTVLTVAVPTNVSAKKDTKHGDDGLPLLENIGYLDVKWLHNGYLVRVTSDSELNMYLIVLSKMGGKSYQKMEYGDGIYSAWISRELAKNKNDIYIALIDAESSLFTGEAGTQRVLDIQLYKLEISGKRDNVRLKLSVVFELQQQLVVTMPDDITLGNRGFEVSLNGIESNKIRREYRGVSFFDVLHSIQLESADSDFFVDSFFDVFYEIDFDERKPGSKAGSFFEITYNLCGKTFNVDSFFDITFKRSPRGTDFSADSFFDVYHDRGLPSPGGPSGDSFFDVFAELETGLPFLGKPGNKYAVDSFFDVFAKAACGDSSSSVWIDIDRMNSFFDVFVEIDLPRLDFPPESFFDVFMGIEPSLFLPKKALESGRVDSFFDVFAKVKNSGLISDVGIYVDGTDSFFDVFVEQDLKPASPGHPAPDIPAESFFDVFVDVSVDSFAETLPDDFGGVHADSSFNVHYEMETELPPAGSGELSPDSFFDVFFELDFERFAETLPDDISRYQVDSFFDVAYDIELPDRTCAIDSFFDALYRVDFHPPDPGSDFFVDSFFDVFTELSADGSGSDLRVDSFFDVFTEITLERESAAGVAETEVVDFRQKSAFPATFGGNEFAVESFFDVFTGLTVDIGSVATGPISPPPEKTLISLESGLTFNGRGIDLDDTGEVMGVEPSPFYIESTLEVISPKVHMAVYQAEHLEGPWYGGGGFNVESFFDVFFEIDTDNESSFPGNLKTATRIDMLSAESTFSHTSIFGISRVANPDPTTGGSDPDETDNATRGRPVQLRHEARTVLAANSTGAGSDTALFVTEKIMLRHPNAYLPGGGGVGNNTGDSGDNDSFVFKGEIVHMTEGRIRTGPNGSDKLTVKGYDKMHVLTRGRTTRSWEDESGSVMGVEPSPFHVDSFFDVQVAGIFSPGGWGFTVDSFFDITTSVSSGVTNPNATPGDSDPEEPENATRRVTSSIRTRTRIVNSNYAVDSFFDVFTEATVDPDSTSSGLVFTGSIKGEYKPGKVDFIGKLTLESTFVYKKGNVTATLRAGSRLTVDVKKNEFTTANFSVEADVSFEVESDVTSTLKINGKIDGKYESGAGLALNGTITLVPPFQYKKGNVSSSINAGAQLSVKVESNAFKGAELTGVVITADVLINDTVLKLKGSIQGKYENNGSDQDDNTDGSYIIDSFFDITCQVKTSENDAGFIYIGYNAVWPDEVFDGTIDEVSFWFEINDAPSSEPEIKTTLRTELIDVIFQANGTLIDVTSENRQIPAGGNDDGNFDLDIINISLRGLQPGKMPIIGKNLLFDFESNNDSHAAEFNFFMGTMSNATGNYTFIDIVVDVYANVTDESGNVEKILLYTDTFKINYSAINVDSRSGSSSIKEVIELVIDHAEYR